MHLEYSINSLTKMLSSLLVILEIVNYNNYYVDNLTKRLPIKFLLLDQERNEIFV